MSLLSQSTAFRRRRLARTQPFDLEGERRLRGVDAVDVDNYASNRRTARAMGVTDNLGLMPDLVADVHATGGNPGRASLDDLFEALGNREPEKALRLFDGANATLRRARRAPIADDHLPAMIPLLEARGAGRSSESIQGSLLMSRASDEGQFHVQSSQPQDCGRYEVVIWGAERDIAETSADIADAEAAIRDLELALRRLEGDMMLAKAELAVALGSAPPAIGAGGLPLVGSALSVAAAGAKIADLEKKINEHQLEIGRYRILIDADLRVRQADAKQRLAKAREELAQCQRAGSG